MRTYLLSASIAAVALIAGCKSDKKEGTEGDLKTKTDEAGAQAMAKAKGYVAPELPPLDTSGSDALWALAPQGTLFGMVASPGSAQIAHGMLTEVAAVVSARPVGAEAVKEARDEVRGDLGFDLLDPDAIKSTGLDLSKGAALFVLKEERALGIFPVVDREAFRKVAKGKLETIDELEIDRLKDDMLCMPKNDLYLCAKSTADLKIFGEKVNGALAKKVAALPSAYRGHMEFAADIPMIEEEEGMSMDEEFKGMLTDVELGAGAIRLDRGSVTFRGLMQGKPQSMLKAATSVSRQLTQALAERGPAGLMSARIPPELWKSQMVAEEDQQLAGVSLQKDILGSLTGEMVMYAGSSDTLSMRAALGISNDKPFKTLLNMGCGMLPALNLGMEITPADGSCKAVVDVSKLPLPDPTLANLLPKNFPVVADVTPTELRITLGDLGEGGAKITSPVGRELLGGDWNITSFAQHLALVKAMQPAWAFISKEAPADELEEAKLGLWVASMVSDFAMGAAVRDDGLHAMLHLKTFAADSDAAFEDYKEAVKTLLDEGSDTFDALATKHPESLAAEAGRVSGGTMVMAGFVGMMAAVSIPAFMKYKQKSMEAKVTIEEKRMEADEALRQAEEAEAKAIEAGRRAEEAAKQTP